MTEHSPDPNPTITWHAHPARQRPRQTLIAGAIILALAGGVFATTTSPWWALAAAVVLLLSLNRFFFPSTFSIDEAGITARYPLRRMRFPWQRLRRFVHDQYGGYLSTRARRSRLDAWSGMHILFGEDREGVVAAIRSRMRRETAT